MITERKEKIMLNKKRGSEREWKEALHTEEDEDENKERRRKMWRKEMGGREETELGEKMNK